MTAIKKLVLASVAVLAVAAFVGVSAASAAQHLWTINGTPVTSTVSTVSKSITDASGHALVLTHTDPFGVVHKLSCTGTDTGTVGPNGADTENTITTTSCTNVQNCTNGNASAVNLPWNTQLNTTLPIRDSISTGGNGTPGWKATCSGITATCTGNTNTAITDNGNGTVTATFDASSPGATSCTDGGSGRVDGSVLISNDFNNPLLGVQP